MAVKKINPLTPGQRFKVVTTFDDITSSKPEKSLVKVKKRSGGRNNDGRMTMRYVGGGHKKNTELLISKEISLAFQPLSSQLSMIQTEPQGLHFYTILMEKKDT